MGWSCRRTGNRNWQRADTQKGEGKWRRGRSRMQWEDCIKGDLGDWEKNGDQLQKMGV